MEELQLKKALILTEDSEETIVSGSKTIAVRSIYKWLLEEESGTSGE
jgi:hypothetical protein